MEVIDSRSLGIVGLLKTYWNGDGFYNHLYDMGVISYKPFTKYQQDIPVFVTQMGPHLLEDLGPLLEAAKGQLFAKIFGHSMGSTGIYLVKL